ncbi:AraC family ligand binding domain-containing protein [Streptomyces sp. NPDC005955]|uniref:cupin domain-containing protein n=1 Tax=Streptomyces sp. NPDC005955 TaxID=3364738 RepID=UPI0036BABAEE
MTTDGGGDSDGSDGWRLDAAERQLDAEVIRVAPGGEYTSPAPEAGDLLLYVTAGSGHLECGSRLEAVDPGCVTWVPPGARHTLTAGAEGLGFLAVRAQPTPSTPPPPPGRDGTGPSGGEPACLLHRVCARCGRLAPQVADRYCAQCGDPLPS